VLASMELEKARDRLDEPAGEFVRELVDEPASDSPLFNRRISVRKGERPRSIEEVLTALNADVLLSNEVPRFSINARNFDSWPFEEPGSEGRRPRA